MAAKPQGIGVLAHGSNAERNVFVDGNAQFGGPVADVFAVDAAREGFVFLFLLH